MFLNQFFIDAISTKHIFYLILLLTDLKFKVSLIFVLFYIRVYSFKRMIIKFVVLIQSIRALV